MKSGDSGTPRARERERVGRLKRQIALREYRVDAEAVAVEILSKLRLVSISRRALLGDGARTDESAQPPGGRS
jgi:hypothetical protein